MIDLPALLKSPPKKRDEISAFHWFTIAEKIIYENITITEKPDFIIHTKSQKIGIEITLAERKSSTKFSLHQIESAQDDFALRLHKGINPKLPLEIHLAFEDDIPVEKKSSDIALEVLIPLINKMSEDMPHHSSKSLIKKICNEIPEFIQRIGLLNDGHKETVVTGSRGTILEYFTEEELLPILKKKHKALIGYQACDEHWLVIVSGQVPPLFPTPRSSPPPILPSIANSYAGVNIKTPISSKFDRVYFFNSPTEPTLLT